MLMRMKLYIIKSPRADWRACLLMFSLAISISFIFLKSDHSFETASSTRESIKVLG